MVSNTDDISMCPDVEPGEEAEDEGCERIDR